MQVGGNRILKIEEGIKDLFFEKVKDSNFV